MSTNITSLYTKILGLPSTVGFQRDIYVGHRGTGAVWTNYRSSLAALFQSLHWQHLEKRTQTLIHNQKRRPVLFGNP